jgi:uncharacterized protein YfaS (alpha-2-macroglobulin family)
MLKRLWIIPFLVLAAGAPAQEDEGRSYFSLNTSKPVRAGEAAEVRVQAQGVKKLDFRLYRVNDPFVFFRQLPDPHQFGGAVRQSPRARTAIEKFAAWKRSWKAKAKDVARMQFSPDNRHVIRTAMEEQPAASDSKKAAAKKGTEFAALPLLNSQQLVREWSQPIQTPNRWEAATIPVEVKDKGLYVLEATNGKLQAYTIVLATDLALVVKGTGGRILMRTVDRMSGEGLPNVPVQLYDFSAKSDIARETSGLDGFVEAKVEDPPEEGVLVMARRDKDFAMTTVSGYSLMTEESRTLMGYVYTDRPVYRPGHPVHYRSILRTQSGAEYKIPDSSSVQVSVEDPEGKPVLKKKMSLSSYGTVSGDLTLPADAPLGYYSVNVSLGGEEREMKAYGGFHVEEYRKPDYEVKVTPESRRMLQGGRMKVQVEAKYYYGEPVPNAKVTYVVHKYRYWPPWYEFDDEMLYDEGEGFGGEQVVEEKGKLDDQGRLSIDVAAPAGEFDTTYRVEARVTDSSNREISGTGSFTATRGPFYVNAQPGKYVYGPGESARVQVETKDYEGGAAPNVAFRLEVAPYAWGSKEKDQPVLLTRQGQTGSDGRTSVDFPAPASGSYHVRVIASANGREIRDTTWLWISGAYSSQGEGEQRIQIIPDKKSYKPGDTAKMLIVTGVQECNLWLSVEGKALFLSKVISVKGGTATVDVPIQSSHAPNIFVEAVFVKDDTLYRGSKSIKVPPIEKQIQVEVQTAKPEYKPGEPAVFHVTAKDYQGKPLSAEFSLGLVDEAIYAVKKEAQPDILNVFYGRTWNRVNTETSLEYYFTGQAGTRRIQLAAVRKKESRAQLKPDRLVEPKVRKNFPDTAFWIADLKTDSSGKAQAEVKFPDSLTTWRATARGVTQDTRVGSAVQKTIVKKNLLVTMATPRFLTEGDEVTVPVLVRNYLPDEQKVKVSLEVQGAQVVSGQTTVISVAAKGEGRVEYRLRAVLGEKAVLTAKALTGTESDALELTLPVEPYGLKLIKPEQIRLSGDSGQHSFTQRFGGDALPNNRFVTVHLTPSVAGAVFGALEYLISYPYGCTEQTMSSFLPNVVVSQALTDLKLETNIDRRDLTKKVRAGLERLYDYQHDDGGWGWWKDDKTDPFMTAYVATGLKQALEAGYSVADYRIAQALQSVAQQFDKNTEMAPDTRAYLLYAMASIEKPAKARVERIWTERDKLTPFGRALLGLALQKAKDPRATEVAQALSAEASADGAEAYWKSNRDPMLDFEVDNSLEATAFAVKLLAKVQPESPLIDKATQWLVNHRDQGYYWSSTKRTAFVIFGLTDVLKRSGELMPDYTARVMFGGKEILSKKFSGADALSPQPVKVRVPVGAGEANPQVQVEKKGAGRLYASVSWDYRSSGAAAGNRAMPASNPLRINRNYYRLKSSNEGGRIVYTMEPLEGEAKPGDLVAVRLSVFGGDGQRYLLVEDPLPTGAEVIPRDDLYDVRGKPAWWRTWYERRELRDSRVAFFPWSVPPEGLEYVYLMRFTNAGAYHVAPARVEQMYQPGHVSWSEAKTLEVKP